MKRIDQIDRSTNRLTKAEKNVIIGFGIAFFIFLFANVYLLKDTHPDQLKEVIVDTIYNYQIDTIYIQSDFRKYSTEFYKAVYSNSYTDFEALLMASIILNRVDSKNFPNTIDSVLKQPSQIFFEDIYVRERLDEIEKLLNIERTPETDIMYLLDVDSHLSESGRKNFHWYANLRQRGVKIRTENYWYFK